MFRTGARHDDCERSTYTTSRGYAVLYRTNTSDNTWHSCLRLCWSRASRPPGAVSTRAAEATRRASVPGRRYVCQSRTSAGSVARGRVRAVEPHAQELAGGRHCRPGHMCDAVLLSLPLQVRLSITQCCVDGCGRVWQLLLDYCSAGVGEDVCSLSTRYIGN